MAGFDDRTPAGPDAVTRKLADLQRQIDELRAARSAEQTTIGRGGLEIVDGGELRVRNPTTGNTIFYAGVSSNNGQYFVSHYRDDGTPMLASYYRDSDNVQVLGWTDRSGRVVVDDDIDGVGLNRPRIPVPGTYRYNNTGSAGAVYAYRSLPAASLSGETELWEGRASIGHPFVEAEGSWGSATGSGNYTYRLYVAGTVIGTWTTTGTELRASTEGPYSVSDRVHYDRVEVRITCQAGGGATGNVACDVRSVYLRGTN